VQTTTHPLKTLKVEKVSIFYVFFLFFVKKHQRGDRMSCLWSCSVIPIFHSGWRELWEIRGDFDLLGIWHPQSTWILILKRTHPKLFFIDLEISRWWWMHGTNTRVWGQIFPWCLFHSFQNKGFGENFFGGGGGRKRVEGMIYRRAMPFVAKRTLLGHLLGLFSGSNEETEQTSSCVMRTCNNLA
jgi:hypothetical protein